LLLRNEAPEHAGVSGVPEFSMTSANSLTLRMKATLRRSLPRRVAKHPLPRAAWRLATRAAGKKYVTVNVQKGLRLTLVAGDPLAFHMLFLGEWEPLATRVLSAVLSPGMVFVDVGAHVGLYSLIAGRIVGTTGKVLAFEPEPTNFRLLQRNI